MLRLLSIELQKLRYNKSMKVITIVYFSLIALMSLLASVEIPFFGKTIYAAEQGIFNFPFIWHFNSFIAATLKIFLAIVIVSLMSNEYSYRTLKQNLIDGLSKREFVFGKVLVVLLYTSLSTVFLIIVSVILGFSFSDYKEFSIVIMDLEYLLAYFIKLLGFFSFCLFLGVWVKRSAFAIGFLAIWWFTEGLAYLGLKFWLFKGTDVADTIVRFFPLEAMSNLIKEPISRLGAIQSAVNAMGSSFEKNYDVQLLDVTIVLVWTALFIYWSYAILKKRDL